MARPRSEAAQQVAELLRTAKESLGLSMAFLTRMDGSTQHLEVVESPVPLIFHDGITQDQETSFCQAIMDGKLPPVMADVTAHPEAMKLPSARLPRLRSFISVPVKLSDGTVYGTFCAAGFTRNNALTPRDKSLMDVLAHAASVILEPGIRENVQYATIEARLAPLLAAGGPTVVLQPIVQLATGDRIGAEALSRFPAEWGLPPDVCFRDADLIGEGHRLEILALGRAADHLDRVSGYIAMNVSPATLVTAECVALLRSLPLDRILLELSEHQPVGDYRSLLAVLDPLRAAGMRLAIDDVGAGFSSLRHIVATSPDVIKLDLSIVAGISADPVLTVLVRSLVAFADGCEAQVVAEGVETAEDAAALAALAVDYGQGWYFGRPGPPEDLVDVRQFAKHSVHK